MKKVIVVLGGGLKIEADGRWRTTNFDEEGDKFGALGDRLRVEAAACLYEKENDILFVASGGHGQLRDVPDTPTVASVIGRELVELGIPAEKIILEENSSNSWQQLQEIKNIITKYNPEKIKVISNRYHLPRLEAMIKKDQELFKLSQGHKIGFQSAEDILLEYKEKEWKEIIEKAYQAEEMKERITLEERGIKDLKEGKYKLR